MKESKKMKMFNRCFWWGGAYVEFGKSQFNTFESFCKFVRLNT